MNKGRHDPYRDFIFYRTYSRWNETLGRRETWGETVDRYVEYMISKLGGKLTREEYLEVGNAILAQEVMPSMRLLWSAGPACDKTNVTAYNCSYIAPTKIQDFGEILYLLTCGAGVGFSVEKEVVNQLPGVKPQVKENQVATISIPDSREGWANSLVWGMNAWFNGLDVEFDYSFIRPAGARLVTMGGRASGPEPLRGLLHFTREKILSRQGKKLRPIDVHDIICKIGDVVVAGGVRRSSEISLSDLGDQEMRGAKKGEFWTTEPQRSMANNSVAYKVKPSQQEFMSEWLALMESGSGERGIFNRANLQAQMPLRRKETAFMGTNPCGEITLRSKQFCNLTEVVARADDTEETLLKKVRIATIIGTYQSSLVNFTYLSPEWKVNCEDEALLGVSITGQFDCPLVRNPEVLKKMKEVSIKTNEQHAKKLGIKPSTSITCVKPSGTVSQLVNASSGMHPRYAPFYIRRVRISATDPLFKMLKDLGITYSPEVGQTVENATTFVLEFPVKSPDGAITAEKMTAIEQLKHWKMVKLNFTEHNPSNTIYVRNDEWLRVGSWVWDNWEIIGGLSFLPHSDHVYKLAPYEPISQEKYEELTSRFPAIDFSQLSLYEKEDNTEGVKTFACAGNLCEIV